MVPSLTRAARGFWLLVCTVLIASFSPTHGKALEIMLHDVASDRVERQRSYARGAVPLPGTPDLSDIAGRLARKGLKRGDAVFLRLFKASSELEVWLRRDTQFTLLDIYPICHWTGTLGPKIREGDKQSPEGFYSIASSQIRLVGRWRNAFNLGFPNPLDRTLKRSGSHILIHGGCSSTGCFAMTDQVQAELYDLLQSAFQGGQKHVHVHVFPFRMTEENLALHKDHPAARSWTELKAGYDAFESTRMPPRVALCGPRYSITAAEPGDPGDPKLWPVLRPQATGSALASSGIAPCTIESEGMNATQAAALTTSSTTTPAPSGLEVDAGLAVTVTATTEPTAPRSDVARVLAKRRNVSRSSATATVPDIHQKAARRLLHVDSGG